MRPIDADWVMNALTVYGQSYDYVSVGRVTEVIEDAPTIEAEPVRRGRWVLDGKYNRHCSLCNENVVWSFNYCPNCGAKMEVNKMYDLISRQAAIDATWFEPSYTDPLNVLTEVRDRLKALPSAQPEQRYTEEELSVFAHGISLSLLSKRSAQHWRYDEDTATEIKFLERLYEKVVADIRGEEV